MDSPQRLKSILVPAWNQAYWTSSAIAERLDALAARRVDRCACCGRIGLMLLRPRSIPPKLISMWELSRRESEALIHKETLLCSWCGAKLRARRLASIIIESFPTTGARPRSLKEWAKRDASQGLKVAEINLIEGVHEAIAPLPFLQTSDYSDVPDDRIPSEDLTRLSYANESFDLVLTSETLEHVPNLNAALLEIHRVLKPRGLHIFTLPVRPSIAKTFTRREIAPDGAIVDHAEPISHPGGDWGYPVFTEFGRDVIEVIDLAGFATTECFGPLTEDDLAQVYVSRKS